MKRILALSLLVFSVVALSISGAGALSAWLAEGARDNLFTTGSLTAAIVEEYEQDQVVYPGETVDKRVDVTNTGQVDSLVRVRVDKVWGRVADGEFVPDSAVSTANILIDWDTVSWRQVGDYYCYLGVLRPGETTDRPLFTQIHIAEETGNSYAGMQAHVTIYMESVQAAYGGPSCWGLTLEDLGIEYSPPGAPTDCTPSVTFRGPGEGFSFVTGCDDILCAWENLIPGESRSQLVAVKNEHSASLPIYIRAENNYRAQSPEQQALVDDLLRELIFIDIAEEGGDTVYSGPLGGRLDADAMTMRDYISLGEFKPRENKDLYVNIFVSPEVDRRYSDLVGKVTWIFKASGVEAPYPPKTGGAAHGWLYRLGMAVSATTLGISIALVKKAEKEKQQ